MKRKSTEPTSRASDALGYLGALARKGADPERMQRETASVVAGWMADAEDDSERQQATEAVEVLRDLLAAGVEETRDAVDNLEREDAAGLRAGQRLLASLEAARTAASEATA